MIDLKNLTIKKAHDHLVKGDFSAVELADAYLKEIEKKNPELNAYLEVFADIKEQAEAADVRIKEGKVDILTGIPFAIKDVILIKGRVASGASKILENYKATYDATAIKKLKDRGAVFLGRANTDEFAMGGSTENSAYGVTKNPWDTSRVAGGSSGGPAAAVAADLCLASLGSDTGGSVRLPGSFCGVVGFKPTYGAVSRSGLMAMASSLDQIGPMTKNLEDAEIIFNAIRGKDVFDSTSIDISLAQEEKKNYTIGVPFDFVGEGVDEKIKKNFSESVELLKKAGCTIVDVKLPNIKYALATYYVIMPAEVSSNMARYDGVKYGLHKEGSDLLGDYLETRRAGFGPEVRRRIMLGTYVLSSGYYDAYYYRANVVRSLIKKDFEDAFKSVDAILTPVSPVPPFKIGERSHDPLSMYLADIFTVTANLTSLPAVSIPSGWDEWEGKRLPIGIQLTAPYAREDVLFSIGKKFERGTI